MKAFDPPPNSDEVTSALEGMTAGGREAAERLASLLYDELRAIAHRHLGRERRHSLRVTDLVGEAYVRLVDQSRVDWKGRTHFLSVAARVMRRVLSDYARAKGRIKRGRGHRRVECDVDEFASPSTDSIDVIEIHEALEKLKRQSEKPASVVELRFFGGLGFKEIAFVLGISRETARDHWIYARIWLKRELRLHARESA